MPAHVEYQLLSKIIADGDMRTVLEEGISPETFLVPEARAVFEHLLFYYQGTKTRNLVPEMDYIEKHFSTVDLPKPSKRMTIEALCKEVKEEWLRKKIEDVMHSAVESYEDDPMGALDRMVQDAKTLKTSSEESRDVLMSDSGGDILREYRQAKEAKG